MYTSWKKKTSHTLKGNNLCIELTRAKHVCIRLYCVATLIFTIRLSFIELLIKYARHQVLAQSPAITTDVFRYSSEYYCVEFIFIVALIK